MNPSNMLSSGTKNADAVIKASPGRIVGVDLIAAAGAPATLDLHDDKDDATGTLVLSMAAVASTADHIVCDIPCRTGIFANVGGAGATYVVRYA